MPKFYSEQQVRLAIQQTIEDLAYEVVDVHRVEDEFNGNLALTEDMDGIVKGFSIENGQELKLL